MPYKNRRTYNVIRQTTESGGNISLCPINGTSPPGFNRVDEKAMQLLPWHDRNVIRRLAEGEVPGNGVDFWSVHSSDYLGGLIPIGAASARHISPGVVEIGYARVRDLESQEIDRRIVAAGLGAAALLSGAQVLQARVPRNLVGQPTIGLEAIGFMDAGPCTRKMELWKMSRPHDFMHKSPGDRMVTFAGFNVIAYSAIESSSPGVYQDDTWRFGALAMSSS